MVASQNNQDDEATTEQDNRRKHVSSRNVVAWFKPLPPFMRELIGQQMEKEEFDRGSPPTYKVEAFGGEEETHIHDESTIKDDPIAEAEWSEYEDAKIAWEVEYNQRLYNVCMLRCMDVEGIDDEQWIKEQEHLGFEIPEDPVERKIHYIKTEYTGNNEDYLSVLQIPFELALAQSEVQLAAEQLFRKFKMEGENAADGSGSDSSEEEVDLADGETASGTDVPESTDST